MDSLSIFCNLIPALFVLYYVLDGWIKGFLYMLISLARLLCSYFLARVASEYGANFLMSLPVVRSQIENVALNQEGAISNVPGGTLLLAGTNLESGVETIAWWLLYAICFVAFFTVLMIFFALLLKLTKMFNHIPLLGTLNKVCGAIEGLVFGMLFALLIIYLVALLLNFFGYPLIASGLLNSWIPRAFRTVAGRLT